MKTATKIFWGLFFIAAAACVLARAYNWFPDVPVVNLVLAILMIPVIVTSLIRLQFVGVFFPLGFIAWLFSAQLANIGITVGFWMLMLVALLLTVGFQLLFHKRHAWRHWQGQVAADGGDPRAHLEANATVEDVSGENINCSASFTASSKYLHSDGLRHTNLRCSFGSLKVYFDNVTLHPDGAAAQVDCSFGQIELYIPRGWQVDNRLTSSFGAAKERTHAAPQPGPTLTLIGGVSFGAVDIYYV
ncbi:MAG: hypothetical protein FWF49_05840 [Oscillospiraceae bacterium]|nr:hypothetical protein [Oscillospiraceae bacterium]